jgi:hypothetical protein
MAASPTKKVGLQLHKTGSTPTPAQKSTSSNFSQATTTTQASNGGSGTQTAPAQIVVSRIVELMMDKICPSNLATSEGLGADNMTCMVIEFNKPTE